MSDPTAPVNRLGEAKKQMSLALGDLDGEQAESLASAIVEVEQVRTQLQVQENSRNVK